MTAAIAAIVVHGSGNGIVPSKIGLPSARVRILRAQLAREEEVIGEQHAVEAGFLGGARDVEQLIGLGERGDLPELHGDPLSATPGSSG